MDFRNLASYKNRELKTIKAGGARYLTNPKFKPEVIIGLAFGSNYDEGSHNKRLAKAILDARKFFGGKIPIIVEKGIGECLTRMGEKNFYSVGENYEKSEKRWLISKVDTAGILMCSKKILEDENLKGNILYVAHPAHMQRVLETAKKKGLEGIPFVAEKVEWVSDNQWWVRNPRIWVLREIFARILLVIENWFALRSR